MFGIIDDLINLIKNLLTDGLFVLVLLVCIAIYYSTNNTSNLRVTYYIDTKDTEFNEQCRKILHHSTINSTHNIVQVLSKKTADIEIYLVPRDEMMIKRGNKPLEMYPGTNKPIYFSWTYQKPKPIIYIDEVNWRYGVPESGLSVTDYRTYVVQHEFLHALGYDHQKCNEVTAPDGVCPIMFQSTRGCPAGFKCGYTITKFDYEKRLPIE